MSITTNIYALSDPLSGDIFYIGKCNNINKRMYKHLRDNRNNPRVNRIRLIVNRGLLPELFVVDTVPMSDWGLWEQHYISLFRSWGFDLTNRSFGGFGASHFPQTGAVISKRKTTDNLNKELLPIPSETISGLYKLFKKRSSDNIIKRRTAHLLKPVLQYSVDGIFIKEWPGAIFVERELGISSVSNCLKGRYKTAGGFVWKYKNNSTT